MGNVIISYQLHKHNVDKCKEDSKTIEIKEIKDKNSDIKEIKNKGDSKEIKIKLVK